ncbi:MAG: tRNA (adenosine(37)-N6)-threonylcarbamoyltransferase complex dimerization subunit type 1 TsaB [Candidatus Saccharimonadales bacterium]
MILCLKTDAPTTEVYVYDGDQLVASRVWGAHRTLARDLLRVCDEVLAEASSSLSRLDSMVVFKGPGSFTGLRIGCTVANTIAYSQSIPIVGTDGESWIDAGLTRLAAGDDDRVVLPHYGAPPRVTAPRK